MSLTVEELVELLEQFPPEAEVRIAQQPSWPFEYSVGEVAAPDEGKVVYIAEGAQLGYLPGEVSSELGWR